MWRGRSRLNIILHPSASDLDDGHVTSNPRSSLLLALLLLVALSLSLLAIALLLRAQLSANDARSLRDHYSFRAESLQPPVYRFNVKGVSFVIPVEALSWVLPGHSGGVDYAMPDLALQAALDLQLATLGERYVADSLHAASDIVRDPGFVVTGAPEVSLDVEKSMLAALFQLSNESSCVALRATHHFSAARLILGRLIEYAAESEIQHRRECEGMSCAQRASHPDWVFFPLDLSILENSGPRVDALESFVKRTLRDLGVPPSHAVFFFSRPGRDLFLEAPHAHFRKTFLDPPLRGSHSLRLSECLYVTAEGHPPWYWGNVPFADQSVDVPYATTLHARTTGTCAARHSVWSQFERSLPRHRPIRVSVASGARRASRIRTRIRTDMMACSTSPHLPPGSCAVLNLTDARLLEGGASVEAATAGLYAASVFCVMPPGDTPLRRGMWDAILLGCIPVVMRPTLTRLGRALRSHVEYYPPWKFPLDAVVPLYSALDPDGYIDDSVLEGPSWLQLQFEPRTTEPWRAAGVPFWLRRLLATPPERIARMQAALLEFAATLQSREPGPARPHSYEEAERMGSRDVTDWLLVDLALKASQRWYR